ncbi:hypothetical protein [Rhodopirellula halodulae]|uniref:hypothetical protein n=1 Tax=Rhodopirellula halodulae TaxID=2894198 RepID=UPI001E3C3323|nr:hypothetical protein [Rhodopirellula sp. JC737]MCC9655304.1 hypothetical protein [Rhodopirellula sp. JC737]
MPQESEEKRFIKVYGGPLDGSKTYETEDPPHTQWNFTFKARKQLHSYRLDVAPNPETKTMDFIYVHEGIAKVPARKRGSKEVIDAMQDSIDILRELHMKDPTK